METKMLVKIAEELAPYRLPRYQEITDVGLYLEQTVRLVNAALAPLGEPPLTISMVSNYVKQKMVESPVRKEYHRDQIALLFFIAFAKSVLSLEEIRFLIGVMGQSGYDVRRAYLFLCRELKEDLAEIMTHNAPKHPYPADAEMSEAKSLFRNVIITVANKIYIDAYFAVFAEKTEKTETAEN
jgi:hypothetical protein